MIKNKITDKLVLVAGIVVLIGAILFQGSALGTSPTTSNLTQYATELFGDTIITLDIQVDKSDWEAMIANAQAKTYIMADVVVNGVTYEDVGVRTKGNASLTQAAEVMYLVAGEALASPTLAQLEQIAADIKSGKTTFAAAAKEFSQDPGSANQGGDLGWAAADIFDPAFRDALTKLHKGQMSAPVHSSFGWHLIELLDTRNVDKTDAAQKDRAYRMLMNRKFSEEAATWMQEQRASAYVKVLSN